MPGGTPSERDLAALRALARRVDPSDPGAQNNLGVLYYERGLHAEASAAFTRALALDPQMATARTNLERLQQETGHYDRLIAELRDRVRRDPQAAGLRHELGQAYLALGQLDQAEEQFETLRRQTPDEAAPLLHLGLVAVQRGDLDQAVTCFEDACRLDPASPVARVHLGQALYNQGLTDRALEELEAAAHRSPTNPDAHHLLGFVYGELGRHEEARAATRRAVELNPALATAQANLTLGPGKPVPRPVASDADRREPAGARAHLTLGLAFRKRGYLTDALREYRLALETGDDGDAARQGLAEVHLLRRDFGPALELYDDLLTRQPGHAGLWNDKGACLHQAGRVDEARVAWERAVSLDPSNALAWNNLGVAHALQGASGPAEEALRSALQVRPGLQPARLNLALLLARRGRRQDAVEVYREVLRTEPEQADAWNGIGQVLMELHQHADARNAFARAVESDPDSAVAHYNLGFCLSHLGRFDEALEHTKRALELEPYYVAQRYRLTLDLQFEESVIPVDVRVSADVATAGLGDAFGFDAAVLDDVFAELAPEEQAAPQAPRDADPFGLARDYLNKGLLEAATAEIARAVTRGASAVEGAVLEGEAYARRGLHGEALERFRAAVEQAPDTAAALQGEAESLAALGRGEEALFHGGMSWVQSPFRGRGKGWSA